MLQARVAIIYYGESRFTISKLERHLGCCLRYPCRLGRNNMHLTTIIYEIIVRRAGCLFLLFLRRDAYAHEMRPAYLEIIAKSLLEIIVISRTGANSRVHR
jgi:hypothetical protein